MVKLITGRTPEIFDDIDDALERVREFEADYKDHNTNPHSGLEVTKDGTVVVNGEEMPMTKTAYSQMLGRLRIPESFANRIDERLLVTNIRRLMKDNQEKEWVVKSGLKDDVRYIRGIVTPRYQPLYDSEVLRKTKTHIETNNVAVDGWDINSNETSMRLTARLPADIAPTTNVGDISKVGIDVVNGTSGMAKLGINLFVYRLVCSNGMVVPESMGGVTKVHVGKNFDETIRNGFQSAFDAADTIAGIWSKAALTLLKDVKPQRQLRQIESLVEASFGRATTQELFDSMDYDSNTVYDLINTITDKAKMHTDPYQRHNVEAVAGRLLTAA